jgi:hypothetical protein
VSESVSARARADTPGGGENPSYSHGRGWTRHKDEGFATYSICSKK